ncbi:MAG: AraC family transcriptional regulator [Ruminococcaceae bacterium]|nr:AraC family transcriptional regulator [Oscillospiraceae bacterium]
MENYEKQGYLHDEYRVFHLKDRERKTFAFHYHDFYKVLLLLNGKVNYCVEGRNFSLEPLDLVLISAGEIHHPEVLDDDEYERVILYLAPDFLDRYTEMADLRTCFEQAHEHGTNVLRVPEAERSQLIRVCRDLAQPPQGFGGALYQRTKVLEFLILLNRAVADQDIRYIPSPQENAKILPILNYINDNLTGALHVDALAEQFYISRYYLMHLFRAETGYTVLGYITEKRLLLARQLMRGGRSITEACFEAGFSNYSSFLRAFKKHYGSLPSATNSLE